MKIKQLPSGSYRIQPMIDGKRYSITFDHKPSKKEMDLAIYERVSKQPAAPNVTKDSFKSCAEEYIKANQNVLSPSSIRGYKSIMRNMPESFMKLSIREIDQIAVQRVVNEYSIDHAPKSVKNFHGFISTVLKMYNPEMILRTNLPQKVKTEMYIPTREEVAAILELVKGTRYEIPFRLSCYGLRRSEICSLSYPEDFDGNVIHVHKAKVYDDEGNEHIKTTKTYASDRHIYLDDDLIKLIKEQGTVYDGFPNSLYRHLVKCQDRLGITHFRFHDMRHYFATELSEMNIPEASIMAMGGWATDSTLKRVYRHSRLQDNLEQQKDIANRIKL